MEFFCDSCLQYIVNSCVKCFPPTKKFQMTGMPVVGDFHGICMVYKDPPSYFSNVFSVYRRRTTNTPPEDYHHAPQTSESLVNQLQHGSRGLLRTLRLLFTFQRHGVLRSHLFVPQLLPSFPYSARPAGNTSKQAFACFLPIALQRRSLFPCYSLKIGSFSSSLLMYHVRSTC